MLSVYSCDDNFTIGYINRIYCVFVVNVGILKLHIILFYMEFDSACYTLTDIFVMPVLLRIEPVHFFCVADLILPTLKPMLQPA